MFSHFKIQIGIEWCLPLFLYFHFIKCFLLTPFDCRCACGPMPDIIRIWGLLIPPADRITSFRAIIRYVVWSRITQLQQPCFYLPKSKVSAVWVNRGLIYASNSHWLKVISSLFTKGYLGDICIIWHVKVWAVRYRL